MSPATTVQPKLDTVTQPIQPPADIPQASQTPRASQTPPVSQSPPASTPAQVRADVMQASRTATPPPIQPPLPQIKKPSTKMPELSTGTGSSSRLISSRLGSQTSGIPWWRSAAKPTDTTWGKTENTEFYSQPNSVLGAAPSVANLAASRSYAPEPPKPPAEPAKGYADYAQDAWDTAKSHGSDLFDWGVAATATKALQKFAPGAITKVIPAATRVGRAAQLARSTLLPVTSVAAGASLPVAALASAGAYAATSAAGEVLDAVGLRPEWAGGDGWGNLGWDQSKFNQDTMSDEGGYWSQVAQMKGFTDPMKSVYAIGEGGLEGANWLYNKFRGGAK